MQHTSSNLKIMIASSGSRSSAQKYTFRIPTWTRNLSSRLPVMSLWHREQPTALPHHSSNGAAISGTRSAGTSVQQQQDRIYLMSCIHLSSENTVLSQDDIGAVRNDRVLFEFLHHRTSRRRNRILLALSCRSIEGVSLTEASTKQIMLDCDWLPNTGQVPS